MCETKKCISLKKVYSKTVLVYLVESDTVTHTLSNTA